MRKYTMMTAAMLMMALMVGALVAQDSITTPGEGPRAEVTEEAETIDCTPSALMLTQAELSRQLRDFATTIESAPDETLATLYEVGKAYHEIALACGYIPEDVEGLVINTKDLDRIMAVFEGLSGDPLRGQLLYNGAEASTAGATLGCSGCHEAGVVAPPVGGTWTRWDEIHSQEEGFEGYSFEQYTVESIIHPWDYFVAGWPEFTMPDFYETQLSYQDLADIVAYLASQDQLIDPAN
jgi:hypothetical protein